MKTEHLNESQKEKYLKYLQNQELEKLDLKELTEIEAHLYECDHCSENIREEYELLIFLRNWTLQKDNETVEKANLIRLLRKKKENTNQERINAAIDKMLGNINSLTYSAVKIYMKAKKTGKRLLSQITFDKNNSPYSYETVLDMSRGEESCKKIKTLTKVNTSDKDEDRMTIALDEKENKITVTIKKENCADEISPIIGLISTSENNSDMDILNLKESYYDDTHYEYTCVFENLDSGRYYLFIANC